MKHDLFGLIQHRLAVRPRRAITDPTQRRAAVLVLLLQEEEPRVLFTRRTQTVEHHKGQISFPGGGQDADDAGPLATALRETEEELGIPRGRVQVLGLLDDVYTFVSGFVITPVVGTIPHPLPVQVNPREIAEVFSVPLRIFRDPARLRVEVRQRPAGERVEVYYYDYGPHQIWGATARIMKGFVDAVFGEERG